MELVIFLGEIIILMVRVGVWLWGFLLKMWLLFVLFGIGVVFLLILMVLLVVVDGFLFFVLIVVWLRNCF